MSTNVGPIDFTVFSSVAPGDVAWSNPGNAAASDNVRASAYLDDDSLVTTQYLRAGSPSGLAAIPADAEIVGIMVEVERCCDNNAPKDYSVRLSNAGTLIGNDKAQAVRWPYVTVEAYASYGGAEDLWGCAPGYWTPANLSDLQFNISATSDYYGAATVYVDHIRITIWYEPTEVQSVVIPTVIPERIPW